MLENCNDFHIPGIQKLSFWFCLWKQKYEFSSHVDFSKIEKGKPNFEWKLQFFPRSEKKKIEFLYV